MEVYTWGRPEGEVGSGNDRARSHPHLVWERSCEPNSAAPMDKGKVAIVGR